MIDSIGPPKERWLEELADKIAKCKIRTTNFYAMPFGYDGSFIYEPDPNKIYQKTLGKERKRLSRLSHFEALAKYEKVRKWCNGK